MKVTLDPNGVAHQIVLNQAEMDLLAMTHVTASDALEGKPLFGSSKSTDSPAQKRIAMMVSMILKDYLTQFLLTDFSFEAFQANANEERDAAQREALLRQYTLNRMRDLESGVQSDPAVAKLFTEVDPNNPVEGLLKILSSLKIGYNALPPELQDGLAVGHSARSPSAPGVPSEVQKAYDDLHHP